MNADPDTQVPHLDLEDLITAANGQAISDRAQEHLADCERCRAEANRWNLVADGVRGLVDAVPEMAGPAQPQLTGPHVLAGPKRRTALATIAAAAVLLIAGASYGVNAALTGRASTTARTGTTVALASVRGCHGLKQADGTLKQVNGTSLVITTASGEPVTVTTTASTLVSMLVPLSYITDGAPVMVAGPSSGGTITALHINIGSRVIGGGHLTVPPGFAAARGTVTRAGAAGFTLVTARGTQITVTTSSRTQVHITPPNATVSQLRIGIATIAVGHIGPHRTLSAMGVLQQPGYHGGITVNGCSPGSIDDAITTALTTGG
jgi:hypothetical protein